VQPRLKTALALDKMVGEISRQRDPENRTDDQMGAPPYCTHYIHGAKGPWRARGVN
jgi:hypothetical protein